MTPEPNSLDFVYQYKEQPHMSRRIEILRKHPEIKQLMTAHGDFGHIKICAVVCVVHIMLAYVSTMKEMCVLYKVAYDSVVGGIFGSMLFLSMHEAAHGLLCGPAHPRLNRLMGMLINLVYGFPIFTFFKKHHLDHHKYQGDVDFDIEYPTKLEIRLFNGSPLMRLAWLQLNSLFLQVRGYLYGPRKIDLDDIINVTSVVLVDLMIFRSQYYHMLGYMMCSGFVAAGIGMVGAWGLAVHTVYFNEEDTLSYYGWMNRLTFNAGYHMEHHDFPNIPARLLPQVRQMAPEFYKDQHQLDSLYSPVFKYLFDRNTGIHSRIKRSIPSLEKDKAKLH